MNLWIARMCIVCAAGVISISASAEITASALKSSAPLTQGAALLNQLDLLSLYFSSDKVAHAPRAIAKAHIEVDSTVLDDRLATRHDELQDFLTRQYAVFVRELQARLQMYAPDVAKAFQPGKDIRFIVKRGVDGAPLAVWSGGKWQWSAKKGVKVGAALPAEQQKTAVTINHAKPASPPALAVSKREKWKSCPAYIGE